MSAQETVGTILPDPQPRDAIHFALYAAQAGEGLEPGTYVKLENGVARMCQRAQAVGMVDPFLPEALHPGQIFWMFLMPNTITGLRHTWDHPAFPENDEAQADVEASEQWLRDFIDRSDAPNYEMLMSALGAEGIVPDVENAGWRDDDETHIRNDGEYIHVSGADAHGDIPPEFWDHVEVVTGKKVPTSERASHFSCSC